MSPEQAMFRAYYAEINKIAWSLRRVTGGALDLALQLRVRPAMRDDVIERVKFIQKKHGIQEEH